MTNLADRVAALESVVSGIHQRRNSTEDLEYRVSLLERAFSLLEGMFLFFKENFTSNV